jgi:hypothetical protein
MTERLGKEKCRGLPVNHHKLYGLADLKKLQRDEDDDELQDLRPPSPHDRYLNEQPQRSSIVMFCSMRETLSLIGKLTLDAVLDRDEIELAIFNQSVNLLV